MAIVLVTGYGGFLGAEISRQLLAAGYQVRGLARGEYPALAAAGVDCLRGDIRNRECVLSASVGCEAIVHTAAKAGAWGSWREYYGSNTWATSHVIEAAVRSNARALVYTSSPSVTFDGRPQRAVDESATYPSRWLCFYPQTKALAERAVLSAAAVGKIFTCALRPHLVWGPGDPHLFPRVVVRARQGRLRRVGTGQNLIDTIHVREAARAHVLAVDRLLDGDSQLNGQALFLTDDQPVACWEWIARILEAADIAVPKRYLSYSAAYKLGTAFELFYGILKMRREPPLTRFVAAQLGLDHYFNIERARRLIDFVPATDRDAELAHCRPWLQELGRMTI